MDKTAIVDRLIKEGKYYFLSRPRRFGKSLLLSTIEAYFLGRRDLFEGLALDRLTEEWESYPVLHLDLNVGDYCNREGLESVLDGLTVGLSYSNMIQECLTVWID